MRKKKLTFENRTAKELFLTLTCDSDCLTIDLSPEREKGSRKIAARAAISVSADNEIVKACIRGPNLFWETGNLCGHAISSLARKDGPIFVITAESKANGPVRQK